MIKAVVFDMDGVLIDAREWHYLALNDALNLFGFNISPNEHLAEFDGLPTSVKLAKLSKTEDLPVGLHSVIEAIKQDRTLRRAAESCFPRLRHLLLLQELKRNAYRIGVATNSIRSTTEAFLNYAGVLPYVDVLITNQDVLKPKPFPDCYLKMAEILDLVPDQILVVEDNPNGIKAASVAGCFVLEVENPNSVSIQNVFRKLSELNN